MRALLALFSILHAVAVSSPAFAQANHSEDKSFHIIGEITDESVDIIIREMTASNANTLYISSTGGFPEPAHRLTMFLRERDAKVVVSMFCLSACFSFVFLNTNRRSVMPGALLAFHTAPAFDFIALNQELPVEYLPGQAKHARLESALNDAAGVSRDIQILQGLALNPMCWAFRPRLNQPEQREAIILYRFGVFFPGKEELAPYGVAYEGETLIDELKANGASRQDQIGRLRERLSKLEERGFIAPMKPFTVGSADLNASVRSYAAGERKPVTACKPDR